MLLKTERLVIRYIVADDWQGIKDIWTDFISSEYAQYDRPLNVEDASVQQCASNWADQNRKADNKFFVVCLQETIIGYLVFYRQGNGYEIGYCFHSDFHGKGYAKESIIALLAYFRAQGITEFSAGTALNNTPSVKLLASLGFQLVGEEKVSFYKDADGNDIIFDGGNLKKVIL